MTKKYANDFKCSNCGKQADVFFGMADPDCEQTPLCNKCCEESKMRIYMDIVRIDKKYDNHN